jgi:hypothetical protein
VCGDTRHNQAKNDENRSNARCQLNEKVPASGTSEHGLAHAAPDRKAGSGAFPGLKQDQKYEEDADNNQNSV